MVAGTAITFLGDNTTLSTGAVPTLTATSNIFSGNITASSFTGNGAGLTNVNAATATTATTAATASNALALGGNAASAFPLLDGNNSFTGYNIFPGANFTNSVTLSGGASVPAQGTATTSQGSSSNALQFTSSVYSNGVASPVNFVLQVDPTNNNTPNASGSLNLYSAVGSAPLTLTGLSFNPDGTLTFAPNQTFSGMISGVTAGAGLTGGGSSGTITLAIDPNQVPTLMASTNVFTGSLSAAAGTFSGNSSTIVSGTNTANGTVGQLGTTVSGDAVGVYGTSSTYGVRGTSTGSGAGVLGTASASNSVGVAGEGNGEGGQGVYGSGVYGVYGYSAPIGGYGVYGTSVNGTGVYGVTQAASSFGVNGVSKPGSGGFGVYGQGDTGAYGVGTNGAVGQLGTSVTVNSGMAPAGVLGSSAAYGVYGIGTGVQSATGVYGTAMGNLEYGVYGTTPSGSGGTGVYGAGDTGVEGYYYVGPSTAGTGELGATYQGMPAGVTGQSFGSGSYGVVGYSTYPGTYGVYGKSPNGGAGYGVYALGDTAVYAASSGPAGYGVNANSAPGTYGYGVYSTGDTGVYGTSTATSYGTGVWGLSPSGTNGTGVLANGDTGVAAYSAPSSGNGGNGVYASSTGTNGSAVFAQSTGMYGIAVNAISGVGQSGSGVSAVGDTGVVSTGTGSIGYGVYAGGWFGVYGQSSTPACTAACPPSGAGIYGVGNNIGVFSSGDLAVDGDEVVTGMKSAVVSLPDDRIVALYAVESPENWFEDFGSAELRGGAAVVALDPTFALTVNAGASYHIFLTPNGDCKGLYVTEKTATGFQVRELQGGRSNISFDYRIVAKRRGYENVRLADLGRDHATAQKVRQSALRARHMLVFPNPPKPPQPQASAEPPRVVAPPVIRAVVPPNPPEPPRLAAPPAPPKLVFPPASPAPASPGPAKPPAPSAAPAGVAPRPLHPAKPPEHPEPPQK